MDFLHRRQIADRPNTDADHPACCAEQDADNDRLLADTRERIERAAALLDQVTSYRDRTTDLR